MKIRLHSRSGFTLIELSIVLVIIGLIVGGILAGQDLIEAAALKRVISTTQSYELGVNTFRTKYDCLPGDCPTITRFFPTTVNGNNNGYYDDEFFLPWEHLSLGGVIAGSYTRTAGSGGGSDAIMGINTPLLGFTSNSGCAFIAFGSVLNPAGYFTMAYQNILYCGIKSVGSYPSDYIFTTSQMRTMDQKIDDGRPGTGKLRTEIQCGTTSDPGTSEYPPPVWGAAAQCILLSLQGQQ